MGTAILMVLLGTLVFAQAQFPNIPGGRPGNPNNPGGGPGNPNFPGGGPGNPNFPGGGPVNPNFPGGGNPNFPGGGNPNFPGGGNPNFPGVRPGNPNIPGFPGGPGSGGFNPMAPMSGCRPGWTNFGKFCYRYFWQRLPYDEANRVCARYSAAMVPGMPGAALRPGHLVVTKDMMHNKFQHNWLRYTGGGNNKVWMGLAELPSDPESNRYFWADGTELFWTRSYPFFNRFKPDQPQQNAHRQAVHSFNNRPDNSWVTTSVETEVSFICQYQYKV